jgi:hypothetical protein
MFRIKIRAGYRDWNMAAVSSKAGNLDELRGNFGNAPVANGPSVS